MAVLAEPQQAGEVADVRVALVELARFVAAYELLDRQSSAAPHFALEERLILALVELDDGGSGWGVIHGHVTRLYDKDRIGTGRKRVEATRDCFNRC